MYVFKLQAKLITEPNPYRSTNTGLSVEPPNKDTRSGQDEIYTKIHPSTRSTLPFFYYSIRLYYQ